MFRKTAKRNKTGKKKGGKSISGRFAVGHSSMAGQEDVEYTTHRYEFSAGAVGTGGAVAFQQIKGNSIYRCIVGATDSVGGYARMYTQYQQSVVESSKVSVTIAGNSVGASSSYRCVIVPCTPSQYTVYAAFTSAAQLRDVPHAVETIWSAGGPPKTVTCRANTADILLGGSKADAAVLASSSAFFGSTGTDPTAIWYYIVALQPLQAITEYATINHAIEYKVKWYKPIGTAVQVTTNRFGNEEIPPAAEIKKVEEKGEFKGIVAASAEDTKLVGSAPLKDRGTDSAASDEYVLVKRSSAQLGLGAGLPAALPDKTGWTKWS